MPSNIQSAVAVSVPVHLESGCKRISKKANYIYQKKFLVSLREKIHAKGNQFPDIIDVSLLDNIKSLYEFDDVYTSKLHGFKDAKDYYTINSSLQFLGGIDIPTLIINALDDPFLPDACYPYKEVENNPYLSMLTPDYGGHVGFVMPGKAHYWDEVVISQFISEHSLLA